MASPSPNPNRRDEQDRATSPNPFAGLKALKQLRLFSERKFEHFMTMCCEASDVAAVLSGPSTSGLGPYAYQPLVSSSSPIDPKQHLYMVEERIRVGPLTLPNRFRARIAPHRDGRGYDLEAWAAASTVYLRATLRWRPSEDGTLRVLETASIRGPAFLLDTVVRLASGAHEEMLRRIADAGNSRANGSRDASWL